MSMNLVMFSTQLVLLLVQLALVRASNLTTENSTFPNLKHCHKTCGDVVNISYPFGFQPGCFRSGFKLICDRNSHQPKLFLADGHTQVTAIDQASVYIVANVSTTIRPTKSYFVKWDMPFSDFFMIAPINTMSIIGCDIDAHLIDPLKGKTPVGSCTSACPSNISNDVDNISFCDGLACCQVEIPYGMKSYRIEIIPHDGSMVSPWIKAFVTTNSYSFKKSDLFGSGINGLPNITMALSWYIPDQRNCSVKTAKDKATYACVDKNSECASYSWGFGYLCQCSNGFEGNPYVPDGCQGYTSWSHDNHSIIYPRSNCPQSCGQIDVPFPFGLEPGCYRNKLFKLDCDNEIQPPSLKLVPTDKHFSKFQITKVLINKGTLQFRTYPDLYGNPYAAFLNLTRPSSGFPSNWIEFTWAIDPVGCTVAKQDKKLYACVSNNAACVDGEGEHGYRCQCNNGFQGNPYVINGCYDVDECKSLNICDGQGVCSNTNGSYICCPFGVSGQGKCIVVKNHANILLGIAIGVSVGLGLLLIFLCSFLLFRRLEKENQKKIKRNNFRKNQGLLLQQLISSNEDISDKTKIFSLEELEKATNKFDQTRVLGHGGHGTVYKGILSDQRVVAIKKANTIERSEINQFINEVAILSPINHRNIVKLLGCCLETEVPLLVYEFITNGTLNEKLHDNHNTICTLSWQDRIKIATEAAGALFYLHSAASISIFHRDIKSSNILLDDNHTAKLSDFGTSRSIPIDQSSVLTIVQGTFGYLDPEYYHTSQLTEKSDVYSFGVILVELLMRKKPIFTDNLGEKINLGNYFLSILNSGHFKEALDSQVLEEATEEEINDMVHLAEMCLKKRGEDRPTMKEVEMRLQVLKTKRRKELERTQNNEEVIFATRSNNLRSLFILDSDLDYIESLYITE